MTIRILDSNTTSSSSSSSSGVVYIPPQVAKYRWLVLVLCCTVTLGNYYCFDIPSVLYEPLAKFFDDIEYFEVEFNMLYIVYSLPNIILPLFGGFLIDQWGHRQMITTFSLFVFSGQLVTSLGCSLKSFSVMLFGRFLFGLGGESLMVSIVSLLSSWFEGKELAFALGLMLSLSRFGSAANDWISPVIETDKGVTLVFWFGAFLCFLSVLMTLFVVTVDYNMKEKFEALAVGGNRNPVCEDDFNGGWDSGNCDETTGFKTFGASPSVSPTSTSNTELVTLSNTQANARIGQDGFSIGENPLADYFQQQEQQQHSVLGQGNVSEHQQQQLLSLDPIAEGDCGDEETGLLSPNSSPKRSYFTLNDLQAHRKYLWPPAHNPSAWFVFGCTFFVYGAICPFINLSNEIIRVAYFKTASEHDEEYSEYVVPRLQSIPFLLSAFLSPVVGILVDSYGNRTVLIASAPLMVLIAHVMMAKALLNPYIPLVLVGCAYSVFAASIWPVIPLVVESNLHGLAFGIMTSVQNLSQTFVPALASLALASHEEPLIHHHHSHPKHPHPPPDLTTMQGIANCEMLFAVLSFFGLLCAICLWYVDEWPDMGPGGFLRRTTKRTIDGLLEHSDDACAPQPPPLPPRTPPGTSGSTGELNDSADYGSGDKITGIALLRNRGSSLGGMSDSSVIPIPVMPSPGPAPIGGAYVDTRSDTTSSQSTSQSPHFSVPWEMYDTPTDSSENSLLLARNKTRSQSASAYGTIGSANRARFSSEDVLGEDMMPLKKAVSFAGDMTFPERKPGQGQHPPIPLKRRNSTISRMRIPHF